MRKHILRLLMILTLCLLFPQGFALAVERTEVPANTSLSADVMKFDLSLGNITISEAEGVTVFKQNETQTSVPDSRALITQSVSGSTKNYIEVLSGNVFLTIQNLNISSTWSPIDMKSGAKLSLELIGENVLTALGEAYSGNGHVAAAGIAVPSGSELTICGNGSVTATGGEGGAGIGGGSYYSKDGNCGLIRIESGSVTAVGSNNGEAGAGIGGAGLLPYAQGYGGTVIITGGTVVATGGNGFDSSGAGIGGSGSRSGCHGGTLIITGGTVNATGGSSRAAGAAGIGGGGSRWTGGRGSRLTITGGKVTASGVITGIGGGNSGLGLL